MTFNPTKPLTDLGDVVSFFEFLHMELKAVWHPDDDFTTYVHLDNKEPSWSKAEGEMLNTRMNEAFDICNRTDKDIYELGMETDILCSNKHREQSEEVEQLSNKGKKKRNGRTKK